jgi:hypothetical protein
MDILTAFGTNKKKEEEGVWVEGADGTEFLVARMGNKQSTALAEKLMRPHRTAQRKGALDNSVLTKITHKVMAHHVLLDWKGVKVGGQLVDYTPELGERLFAEVPDFAEFISDFASQIKLFQDEEQQESEKNS